jgi:hypothetical protein
VLFEYWTDINPSLWIVIFIALTVAVGLSFIGVYGEIEFWFALLKICFIVFLILLGLIIDLGGVPGTPRIGFRYWHKPGPFVEFVGTGHWGRFLAYWAVMSNAVFSFAGVESVAMAAAETKNPRVTIPRACKRVFVRVATFYVLAVLVVGMLVPSDDPRLSDNSGTAAQSPFVIAASAAGLKGVPSVVNAVVITSAWSSSNQALLSGTRVLYGLALKNQAPALFLRTTAAWGVPYLCVLFYAAFMFLAFMSLSNTAMAVFWWLVDLTACGVLVSWITVLLNHQRLMMAMRKQGWALSRLPWHSRWTGTLLIDTRHYSPTSILILIDFAGHRILYTCRAGHVRRHPVHGRLPRLHQRELVYKWICIALLVSHLPKHAYPIRGLILTTSLLCFSFQRHPPRRHGVPRVEDVQRHEIRQAGRHSLARGAGTGSERRRGRDTASAVATHARLSLGLEQGLTFKLCLL